MKDLQKALTSQNKELDRLMECQIYCFRGFGVRQILVFDKLLHSYNEIPSHDVTQRLINEGYYTSIVDFDSYYTADISFDDLYSGEDIHVYRMKTLHGLRKLGERWRKRIRLEFPDSTVWIVVHKEGDEWYLDTFNHPVDIEDAIYL
jgi:hypothetical protein